MNGKQLSKKMLLVCVLVYIMEERTNEMNEWAIGYDISLLVNGSILMMMITMIH
jgi:hypothetical protein